MAEKKTTYVGTSPSYENAANETDIPRYSNEEKKDFARFGQTPEPEEANAFYHNSGDKEEKAEESQEKSETPKRPGTTTPTR